MARSQKPRRKHRPGPAMAPVLVAMHLAPEVGIHERLAVEAMSHGWATTAHWNELLDCLDMLTMAAEARRDQPGVIAVCTAARYALANIRDRHAQVGRFGCTADELAALRTLADVSEDFWQRQSGSLFASAHQALERLRGMQAGKFNAEVRGASRPAGGASASSVVLGAARPGKG